MLEDGAFRGSSESFRKGSLQVLKDYIFKGLKPIRKLTTGSLGMFADWTIKPEELKNVLNRADSLMGHEWEEAFKAEKKK